MKGILADENLEGHVRRLVADITASEWIDDWKTYNFGFYSFDECGLRTGINDRAVYSYCQRVRIALVTANRNYEGPDSLEAAIRDGSADDIPVFTLADADRVLTDPIYAKEVAEDLLDAMEAVIDRPESIVGSGRVYLPRKPIPS